MSIDSTANIIQQQRILPLFYHSDEKACIAVVDALYKGGVKAVEFTNRGTHALQNTLSLIAYRDKYLPQLLIGVGTIQNETEAKTFIEAGADFLVSPFFDTAVCDEAYLNKVLWIPGCMTPTEIHTAQQAGCTLIKLFPGDVLGINFVKSIKPLFRDTSFVVTGGVEAEATSIKKWLDAGVVAVGLGSKLITNELFTQQSFNSLTLKVQELLKTLQNDS